MAIGSQNKGFQDEDAETLKKLEQEYTEKINKSKFKYNKLAGDFSFGDISLYFWQAFLETSPLRIDKVNNFLISKPFKFVFFSALQTRVWMRKDGSSKQLQFNDIVKLNKCFLPMIKLGAILIFFGILMYKPLNLLYRIFRKLNRMFISSSVRIFYNRSSYQELTIKESSEIVIKNMNKIFPLVSNVSIMNAEKHKNENKSFKEKLK
jgi:hypothetical protein